jgi:hypothetical protein
MRTPDPKMREANRVRFWILLADVVGTGLISVLVTPPKVVSDVTFSVSKQLDIGRQGVGMLFFVLGVWLLVARYTSSKASRVAHAWTGGIYALFGVALCFAVVIHQFYTAANGLHLLVIAWAHYSAATEQDPIVGEGKSG